MTTVTRRRALALAGASSVSLALAGALRAEGGSAGAPLPFAVQTPLRVGHVELTVRDLRRSHWFYEYVLGFDVLEQSSKQVSLGVDGKPLIILHHDKDARPQNIREAGLYHTAFLMPSRADLARWLVHAVAMGVPFSGFADHRVSEAIYLDDPDGNGVEVYSDRSPESWEWDGDRVVMGSLPIDIDGLLALVPNDHDTFNGAAPSTRVGHVHLRAGHIPTAKSFYAELLGLDVVSGSEDSVFLSSGRYHHHIALNVWQSAGAGLRSPRSAGLHSLCLEVNDDTWIERISARAMAITPIQHGIAVKDPWGTTIELRRI